LPKYWQDSEGNGALKVSTEKSAFNYFAWGRCTNWIYYGVTGIQVEARNQQQWITIHT
jgi:hypothetical protein